MIYPVIKDETIGHEMENFPAGGIGGAEVMHQKWISRQLVSAVQ